MWWCICLALLPCIASATACQPGWTPVSFGHNIGTACVIQSDMNLTAPSAELYCMQRHATLLEFDTVQSITDISAQFQSDLWIGAIIHTNHTASVQLSWISGAPVNATIIPTIILPPPDSHRRCVQLHAGSSTLLAQGSLMSWSIRCDLAHRSLARIYARTLASHCTYFLQLAIPLCLPCVYSPRRQCIQTGRHGAALMAGLWLPVIAPVHPSAPSSLGMQVRGAAHRLSARHGEDDWPTCRPCASGPLPRCSTAPCR